MQSGRAMAPKIAQDIAQQLGQVPPPMTPPTPSGDSVSPPPATAAAPAFIVEEKADAVNVSGGTRRRWNKTKERQGFVDASSGSVAPTAARGARAFFEMEAEASDKGDDEAELEELQWQTLRELARR